MKTIFTLAVSCCLLFTLTSTLTADQPKPTFDLVPAMANLAGEIHAYMKGKDQETGPVNVGSFKYVTNPNEANARDVTTQAGFQQMLQDALGKLKHPSQPDAPFSVTGTYSTTEVELGGRRCLGLQVNVEITDGVGKRSKFTFSDEVVGEAAILAGLGITMALDPKNDREQNDNDIRRQLLDPKFSQAGDTVFSSEGSQFGVEILVRGRSVKVDGKDGHATIQLRRDDAYEIRLINKAPFEVAANVSIDGINMFTFSTVRDDAKNQPRYSSLIVPAAEGDKPGSVIVPGWHRSDEDRGFDQFLITEYAKSAAGKLNKTTDLGTISVLWQACWGKDQPMPKAIAQSEPGKRRGGLGDATGFGQPTGGRSQAVVRELGVVRDSVCIRYSSEK